MGRPAGRLTDAYGLLDVILHTRLKLGCAGRNGLNLNAVGVGWQCVASLFRFLTLDLDATAVSIVRVAALRSILTLVLVTIVRVAALRSILTLDLVTIATIVVTGVVTVATVVVAMILVVEVILDDLAQADARNQDEPPLIVLGGTVGGFAVARLLTLNLVGGYGLVLIVDVLVLSDVVRILRSGIRGVLTLLVDLSGCLLYTSPSPRD